MRLEPGPIPPIDASQFTVQWETPDFSDMVTNAWHEIDGVTLEMDSLIDPAAIFDHVLTGDTILADLDAVDQINGDNAHLVNLSGIEIGDGLKANGDTSFIYAAQAIPGEAWTPVPASTGYGTVTQPAPTANFAGVTLLDLTTMSGTNFNTGDQFQLQVHMDTSTGHVADYYNVHVWAELALDQQQQANLELGPTDATGVVTYHGRWEAGDAGVWAMFLHAAPTTGGDVVSQQYQWTVASAVVKHPGGTHSGVTVKLTDVTSGSLSNCHVGDSWELEITGPPNMGVYIWGTKDGVALTEAQLGSTAPDGTFRTSGVWVHADAGDWVEYYAVGRFAWPSHLAFTIEPAAGAGGGGPGGGLGV